MKMAGGIIAIIAGILATLISLYTLGVGGMSNSIVAGTGNEAVEVGWLGIFFSFVVIILGAVSFSSKNKNLGILLILAAINGVVFGNMLNAAFMALAIVAGILVTMGARAEAQAGVGLIVEGTAAPQPSAGNRTLYLALLGVALVVLGAGASYIFVKQTQRPESNPNEALVQEQKAAIEAAEAAQADLQKSLQTMEAEITQVEQDAAQAGTQAEDEIRQILNQNGIYADGLIEQAKAQQEFERIAAESSNEAKQSIQCSEASTYVERTICGDDELKKLDQRMVADYKDMSKIYSSEAEFARDHAKWLAELDACTSRDCIKQQYENKFSEWEAVESLE